MNDNSTGNTQTFTLTDNASGDQYVLPVLESSVGPASLMSENSTRIQDVLLMIQATHRQGAASPGLPILTVRREYYFTEDIRSRIWPNIQISRKFATFCFMANCQPQTKRLNLSMM